MDALHWWLQGDAVTQGAAVVLLAMSVASWVVMLWKARLVLRAGGDVARCTAAVWQSPSLDVAAQRLAALDSQALVAPLVAAAQGVVQPSPASAAAKGEQRQQAVLATKGLQPEVRLTKVPHAQHKRVICPFGHCLSAGGNVRLRT